MVGEIRDGETAQIACRAALVGRLVLSTLHTGTPEAALMRLVDLGVEDYIVRDVLRGVLGEALEPVACAACGSHGCLACQHTGMVGRKLKAELRR